MAFPSDHVYPPELPVWLLNGHSLTAGERVEATQFEQGEDRHREIRTFTPYLASVSTILDADEFDVLHAWFEDDVQAGSLRFDTQVGGLDGSLTQWWEAQFLGPYRYEAFRTPEGLKFVVNAELILLDGPYDVEDEEGDPVRVAPTVSGRSTADTDAFTRITAPDIHGQSIADTDGWGIFDTTMRGRSEADSEGWAIISGVFILLEDGDFMEFEDGERVEEEP